MKYKIRTFKTTYKTFSFIRLTLRYFPCSENGYLETFGFSVPLLRKVSARHPMTRNVPFLFMVLTASPFSPPYG